MLAPHLDLLNRKLVQIATGQIKRLIISMAPRHGKSLMTSCYFPSWYLGTFPDRRIILASYEADFAAEWGRKVRDNIDEFGEEYFGVRVRSDSSAADRWDLEGRDGGMRTAGVGGPITGKGAHLLICDDPIKNAEEANSPTIRQRHKDWWRSTAYTRLEPDGAAVIMCTRWHEDDLPGWLIQEAKAEGDQWEILNLPALAEDDDPLGRKPGEALWPERFSVGRLQQIKKTLGSYWFSAMYMGRPQPADGGCFKRQWFRYFTVEQDGELYRLHLKDGTKVVQAKHCRRFATVDLAFSLKQSADYTVIAVWAVTPEGDLLLVDLLRDRLDGPDLVPAIERMYRRHRLDYVGIEDVQAQSLVVREARRRGLTVRSLVPDKDKVTRAIPATIRMEAEQVFFLQGASWLGDVEGEILAFPNGAHDDVVDCLSYGARDVAQYGAAPEPPEIAEERAKEQAAAEEQAFRDPNNDFWWQ